MSMAASTETLKLIDLKVSAVSCWRQQKWRWWADECKRRAYIASSAWTG